MGIFDIIHKIEGSQSFPKFDMFHAHCAMTYEFKEASCLDVFNIMKEKTLDWDPEPKNGGIYNIWRSTEIEELWVTRTTPKKHYVDDIKWDYFGEEANFQAPGCKVEGKSRSRSLSYYDYDTNYCNMWNVFQQIPEAR